MAPAPKKAKPAPQSTLLSEAWQSWLQPLQAAKASQSPLPEILNLGDELQAGLDARLDADGAKKMTDAKFAAHLLAISKTCLADARAALHTAFMQNNDGVFYVGNHAWIIDQLLVFLFTKNAERCGSAALKERMSVGAVGGYGRGELAPFSDLDILFLVPNQPDKKIIKTIEATLYILWDLGLKVGHATRSIAQSLEMARADQTVMTGLLEMRHIAGDKGLWTRFAKVVDTEIGKSKSSEFVQTKLAERDERHNRLGATRYVVEPNIKEGKGGLRDLHSLFWIAKFANRIDSVTDVVEQGILRTSEARRFAAAQRFLWTVRCHLHFHAGRPEERLDFDAQMNIAPMMGFADRGGLRAVERFMKRYYLAARDVGNLTRIICAAMETDTRRLFKFFGAGLLSGQRFDPFTIRNGRIDLDETMLFRDDPLRMLKIFELALEHDADIHPHSLQRITRALPFLGEETRQNREANALFLSILTSKKNPERILRLMNESGVIGKFLPDFGRIVAMMQFDMYHSYTVDEHTIQAMGILHAIETGALMELAPVATEAMPEIVSRRALYVAMLLHDIAKGRGGDHSILGAEVAHNVCPRLGLTNEETETISWLIRHHLLMSKTAFRYDLSDPKTIEDFAAIVQSPERLKLLLILTVADIRAVGPNIWNGWKAALMRDLYHRTNAVLRGADPAIMLAGNVEHARAETRTGLDGWSDAEFANHVDNLPDNYWTSYDTASQIRHAELSKKFRTLAVPLLADFKANPARKATELTVLTVDDPGLFSRIAGAVASSGVTIAGARITTCSDGTVLDEFVLQSEDNQMIDDPALLQRLQENVENGLTGKLRPKEALAARWQQTPKRVRQIPVPSRVILSNRISSTHTVIEVNGRDFPGLLHRITMTLADFGLQIQSSTVSTYGERVVDVFYVKDLFGLQIHNEARLAKIRAALLTVFDDATETNMSETNTNESLPKEISI